MHIIIKRTLKMLVSVIAMFAGFSLTNAQSYNQKNIEAHQAILGTEPEEFLQNGTHYTNIGNINYATSAIHGLHAILNEKTFFTTKFEEYEQEEIDATNGNNAYGIQIDTVNNTIKDHNDNLINSFTNQDDFYNKIHSAIDELVIQDIDVSPVNVQEYLINLLGDTYLKKFGPNPTLGEIDFDINKKGKDVKLYIFDMQFRLIGEYELDKKNNINISNFADGVYNFVFSNGYRKETKKVIKQ